MSRRRDKAAPTAGMWVRLSRGHYRYAGAPVEVRRRSDVWEVWGGAWDGGRFPTLSSAQVRVEQVEDLRV